MPRQVSKARKLKWTDLADKGLSASEIRTEDGDNPDLRTVRRAVAELQAARQRQLAREQALVLGLREHWTILLDALSSVPKQGFYWEPQRTRPIYAIDETHLRGDGWTANHSSDGWIIELEFEKKIEIKLLKEHLKKDDFWDLLETFKVDMGKALAARMEMAEYVSRQAAELTNLNIGDRPEDTGLFLVGLNKIDEYISARARGSDLRPPHLSVSGREVTISGALLARGEGSNESSLEPTLSAMIKGLTKSEYWRRLLSTSTRLTQAVISLRHEAEILMISTVLPGECKSCKRYST
ncbi:MAG: hypothetical protein HQ477_00180 [Chloroflexi bacterium]|nr:hypothetical protein [Chloroflexota bacterium]